MKRIFSSIPEEKERRQPSWKIRCRPMWHIEESAILIADGKVRKQRFEEKISETVTKVLFEESVTIDGKVYASGHTMEYIRMLMETTENLRQSDSFGKGRKRTLSGLSAVHKSSVLSSGLFSKPL